MRKQFVVIGLGRFGKSVATNLSALGCDVLAIDTNEQAVQAVANHVTHAVQADAREEETLKALGIRNFDVAIVSIGNDIEANILITVMLKDIGVKKIVAKAQNNLHGKVLEKVGADKIVYPEKDMGTRLAHNLVSANVMDYIELLPDISIMEIISPIAFHNKSLGELDLRAQYGISVLAIKKENTILVAPGAEAMIESKDILIVICNNDIMSKLPQ
ncbi:MAG: potassium uptake system protein [Firmicutes bacterium HGW-Firmicutes-12]|jgi:trk system potassium uptake protein TrkA|nr:MAG: potassium uptake system protein [Firmicutes bacterium HGW-Firmicutes-12]